MSIKNLSVASVLNRYRDWLSGRSGYADLPTRVQGHIRSQQESSEILIGWVQLGVVTAFAVLYTVSPKTFTEAAEFAPVPWVLSAYFGFTLLRLTLAYRRLLPNWLLYLSVIIDMLLLLGLIWSFHLQYQQPPSFYLKAPTVLYVFIFIALRALHFEVRFVVLAGLVAALGWLLMVWYVISIDPHNSMITNDYVKYMTSNSVLLGAEFDKIISILTVTAILAVAIARARQLLIRAVVEGDAAHELSRFVPTEVVKQVTSSEHGAEAGQGELREATILFTDIEGFTALSESLSPEELIRTLNQYFAAVVEPIERYGGVINQFQGDAILATFNLPKLLPDHAAEAVRAALAIQEILAQQQFGDGVKLRSRIGINCGVVVGGLVGSGDRLGYTVHGDDVNMAARLEQLNKDYGTRIILSKRACDLAGWERFTFQRVDQVQLRGRTQPTIIYTLPTSADI